MGWSTRALTILFLASVCASAQFQPIRINCGGNDYTATDGSLWLADRYFTGGANMYTSDGITGTPELMLYRPGRYSLYGDFYYQIPVPNGAYNLKLKFAEIQFWGPGYRVFHVDVNGTRVLANYDIAADVGARKAVDKTFPVNVTNGQVRIDFTGVVARGLINAIEVTQATSPALSLTPAALTFAAVAGTNPAAQNVAVNIAGGTASWSASSNAAWLTAAPASGTASGTLAVSANTAGLSPGVYSGAITVTAAGATGSPSQVAVTLNVAAPPTLSVSPASLNFSATAGGGNPAAQAVNIAIAGGAANWSAASNAAWLSATPGSGANAGTISVAANITGLTAGTYTGAVTVTAPGAVGSPAVVNVSLTVQPVVSVSPASLSFTATAGAANPAAQVVALSVTGGTANWSAASNAAWLAVTPASGSAAAALSVAVNAAGLNAGSYSGVITVSGANFASRTVAVSLTVNASVTLSPGTLSFSGTAGGANPAAQTASLAVAGGTTAWTATPGAAWLSVSPASGSAAATLTANVNLAGLAAGNYTSGIVVAGPGIATQNLVVTLNVGAAPTISLSPATLSFSAVSGGAAPATQSINLGMSGGTANWTATSSAGWLSVTPGAGSAASSLTASVNAAGLAAGTYSATITVSGAALATQTAAVTLTVNPSVTLTPGTLTFSGAAGGANPASQPVSLAVNGVTANWTASSSAAWLTVSPASGTAAGTLAVGANMAGLAPGTYNGTINVTGTNFAAQSVAVTLSVSASLSAAPATLTFTAVSSGAAPPSQPITISANGAPTWTASANAPWLAVSPAAGSGAATLAVSVSPQGLGPGTLSGAVTVQSPGLAAQTIAVTFNVTPSVTLTTAPPVLFYIGALNGPPPAPQTLTLQVGGGPAAWTAQSNQAWLTVTPASGTTSLDTQVAVATAGLPLGSYNGAITFTASGALPLTVPVTLRVAPPITVSPGGINFFSTAGGANPAAQTFTIQPSASNIAWTVSSFRPWVAVTPSAGSGTQAASVNVNTSGLAPGVYNDTIVVSAANQDNAPAIVNLQLAISASGQTTTDYYVSPTGAATNNGSIGQPWDLATALAHPAVVRPGDRIWLRSGVYGNGQVNFLSRLAGSASAPIIVRNYPGERAAINGYLQVGCCDVTPDPSQGAYVWFWGLEIFNSTTDRTGCAAGPPCWGATPSRPGVDLFAPGARLINCIIHDTTQGLGFWNSSTGSEAYGNLIYFNGYQASDRAHGHGIYAQNELPTKKISDNIIFDQFGFGLHLYGSSNSYVRNFLVEGNVVFNNGAISTNSTLDDNILVAGGSGEARAITVRNNHFYNPPERDSGYNELGFAWSSQNQDLTATGNFFVGGYEVIDLWKWQAVTFTGNTVYAKTWTKVGLDTGAQPWTGYLWNNNTYYGGGQFRFNGLWRDYGYWRSATGFDAASTNNTSDPTGVWTFVRPNGYEPGRANVIVYNWALQNQVAVDLSGVLATGAAFEIRDAQNFYGPVVASGIYSGGPVNVPMTGLAMASPIGTVPTRPVHTAPKFGAFVVLPAGTAPLN